MKEAVIIFVLTNSYKEAEEIAKILVEKHLAGAVNIISNVRSIYFWKGKIYDEREILLLIKTIEDKFETIKEEILKIHSYEVPEISMIKVEKAFEKFLTWLEDTVT